MTLVEWLLLMNFFATLARVVMDIRRYRFEQGKWAQQKERL